jgi:hypothetical protein
VFQGALPCPASAYAPGTLRGDLNGDGRDDVCERGPLGVTCSLSTGTGFTTATTWLDDKLAALDGLQLADVNGDGRADLCADSPAGVVCGLAP